MDMQNKNNYEESKWQEIETKIKLSLFCLMNELLQSCSISTFIYKILLIIEAIQMAYYAINPSFDFLWSSSATNSFQKALQYFQFNGIISEGSSSVSYLNIYKYVKVQQCQKDKNKIFNLSNINIYPMSLELYQFKQQLDFKILAYLIQYQNFDFSLIYQKILIPLVYFTFGVQLVMSFIFFFLLFRLNKKQQKTTTFSLYCIKLLSLYAIILTTVGLIPFLNSCISIIYCTNESMNCYSGIFFMHLTIAIISAILLITQSILYIQLFIDLNPCSHLPFASPQNKISLIKFAIKFILPLYTSLNPSGSLGKVFVAALMVLMLLLLIQRYLSCPMYNRSVETLLGILEVSVFWICIGSLISGILSDATVGLFYLFIALPFVCLVYQMILHKRNTSFMTKQTKSFKKDQETENYIIILLNLIDSRDQAYPSIQLEGVLKYHMRTCTKQVSQCFCRTFSLMKEEDDDDNNFNAQSNAYGEANQKTKNWYIFLRSIISDAIERYPKSSRLHLLHAYILQGKLQNKFKSLFALMFASECKPNLQEEFSIYRYKHIIEEEIIEYDIRTQESKGIEVNSIVNFQNKFVAFLSYIERAVVLHLEFWSKLLEENPDTQKILSLGSKITNTVDQVAILFQQLQEINQNHIKCLEIYGNFLKEIVHDDQEGTKIMEKAEYVSKSNQANKQFVDSDKIKYGENSNTCIITISGNLNSVGTISNTNNETMRLLGFKKNEIMDQNVNRIMPKVIGDMHDKFMRRFFDTSQSNLIGHERTVFCLHKKGYLIPSTIMIKVLPNLDNGIQIVGFIKEIEHGTKGQYEHYEEVHYLIFREDTFQIQGITETCYTNFGIPASLMYGNTSNAPEFTVDSILPGVVDPKNSDDLKSVHGQVMQIDTTYVQQNFLIEDELDSMLEEDDQQQPMKSSDDQVITTNPNGANPATITKRKNKYRQANVRVFLLDELDLGDNLVIKVIKFVEVENQQDYGENQQQIDHDNAQNVQKKNFENTKKTQNQNDYGQYNQDSNQEGVGEEDGSNISGASISDDLRHLKDFKQMISEKTEPKSILVLKRTVLLLLIILMVLSIVTLVMKVQQKQDVREGVGAIDDSCTQINLIEQVNYFSRLLWLVGNSMLNQDQEQNKEQFLKDNIETYVNQLQDTVFSVVRDGIKMDNRKSGSSYDDQLSFSILQQTGKVNLENKTFSTAIFQYITGASSLKNATLNSFIPKPLTSGQYVESTQIYFHFVRENGLQVFREAAFKQVDTFYSFYLDLAQSYKTTFLIITIVAILILVITQIILIPIVFSVIKTNNKVLSLFGYIPLEEIKELTSRCEVFIKNFLSLEANEGHNDGDDQSQQNNKNNNNENTKNVKNPYDENDQLATVENEKRNEMSSAAPQALSKFAKGTASNAAGIYELNGEDNLDQSMQIEIQHSHQNPSKIHQNASKVDQNSSVVSHLVDASKTDRNKPATPAVGNKKQEQDKEAQDLEEFESMRIAKLLNQTDNNKKYVIIKFSFLAILFITYFVLRFVFEQQYLESMKHLYNHTQIIALRPTYTQYVLLYTVEQIVMKQPISSTTEVDLRAYYTAQIYDIQKQISSSGQDSFPSAFSSYLSSYNSTEYGDICESSDYASKKLQECQQIQNGILETGLQTAIVAFVEGLSDFIFEFKSKLNSNINDPSNDQVQKNYLNSAKFFQFEKAMEFMKPTMLETNQLMVDNFNSMLDQNQNIEIIILCVFITVIIIIFFLVWIPYLKSLSNKIWRTKGMLNMIPIEVITKHESLKNAFISGDILRAVK